MTDDEWLDGMREAVESQLTRVYVTERADSAIAAAQEGMSLEGYAACAIVARMAAALDAYLHDVQDGRRQEPLL